MAASAKSRSGGVVKRARRRTLYVRAASGHSSGMIGVIGALAVLLAAPSGTGDMPRRPAAPNPARDYGRLPVVFEANRGQSDPRVRFLAHSAGVGLFLTARGATLALEDGRQVVRLSLVGSRTPARTKGISRLPGTVNYLGLHHTGIPTFGGVRYVDAWPGVSLDFRGSDSQLEYDFRLAAGADPSRIALRLTGARGLHLNADGDLVAALAHGNLRQPRPVAYQQVGYRRRLVPASYVLGPGGKVALRLGAYDRRRPLVVDPKIHYSTYLGGGGDEYAGHLVLPTIAVDAAGDAYVTGETTSTDFPTTSGALSRRRSSGEVDAFVAKLDPAGRRLAYSTYLGPGLGHGIAVDAAGDAYVTGSAGSSRFPVTPGAYSRCAAGTVFIAKLDPGGSTLGYSTCLHGGSLSPAGAIAVDAAGAAYVTGTTGGGPPGCSTCGLDFATPGAFQTRPHGGGEAFVAKLDPTGSALVYATFLSGRGADAGHGIAIDATGAAYVTGYTESKDFPTSAHAFQRGQRGPRNVFVAKLSPSGSALEYATRLRGHGGLYDEGDAIAVDGAGAAYVTGLAEERDFPTTRRAFRRSVARGDSTFVTKLAPAGRALVYSGVKPGLGGHGIAVDTTGAAYVVGPCACVVKVSPSGGALIYSTNIGSARSLANGGGIAIDPHGNAYVTGSARRHFRTTAGALQPSYGGGKNDGFVAKLASG